MIATMHDYVVTVVEEEEGPEPELRERLATVAAYRLGRLEEREGHYPEVGGQFDMLDHFEGPFFWERTDESMVDDPPTRVDFEIVAVDPAAPSDQPGRVQVSVRVPF
jgi:hypothetical protein